MGNCLVIGDQTIKVVKPDGKILEYRSPIRALDVISKFTGHEISETTSRSTTTTTIIPAIQQSYLRPEAKLRRGNIYYLVPFKPEDGGSVKIKKRVRFSEPEKEYLVKEQEQDQEEEKGTSKSVRIKVVISKQELQELLSKGGISVDDVASQLQNGVKRLLSQSCDEGDHDRKPILESIPEVN